MHRRALQVAGVIGLFISGVTCMASEHETSVPDVGASPGTGTGGESSGGYGGPSKSGAYSENIAQGIPAGGAGGGGGDDGGAGGAGGLKGDPAPDECVKMAQLTFTAVLAVEDTNAYASPAYVRDILKTDDGDAPSLGLIKPHEFFNYYSLPYDAPKELLFGLTAGMREVAPGSGEYRFLVGVTAPKKATARPRVNVAIVVDTSLSMTTAAMVRARAIARAIGKSLREGDVVSLVTWNPDAPPKPAALVVSGPEDPMFTSAVDKLYADGGSDLQAGLVRGYELVEKSYDPSALNRLVFISDGRVTLGDWEEEIVRAHAQGLEGEGKKVLLVGAATGPAPGYVDSMMTKMTGAGLGSYVYVDSEVEAARLFHDRFDEVMGKPFFDTVTISIDVPGYFSMPEPNPNDASYSSDPMAVVGRPLAPGDSMTFNQVMKACHPLVINDDHPAGITVSWRLHGDPVLQTGDKIPFSIGELTKATHPGILKANAIALYVDALRSGGGKGDPAVLLDAWTEIDTINSTWFKPEAGKPGDPELEEILALLKRHPKYSAPSQP
jgi:Ca-activated chloride channel family protein